MQKLNPHSVYVPDYTRSDLEIMLGLINFENDKGYAPDDVALRNLLPLTDHASGKNATIEVDLLKAPSEVEGDWVQFFFDRMPLLEVFGPIIAEGKHNIRHVEVFENDEFKPELFISEVLRKYGVNIAAGFEIEMPTANIIRLTATAANYAWIGAMDFVVDASLSLRVVIRDLLGFSADHVDLEKLEAPKIGEITVQSRVNHGTALTPSIEVLNANLAGELTYVWTVREDSKSWVTLPDNTSQITFNNAAGTGTVYFMVTVSNEKGEVKSGLATTYVDYVATGKPVITEYFPVEKADHWPDDVPNSYVTLDKVISGSSCSYRWFKSEAGGDYVEFGGNTPYAEHVYEWDATVGNPFDLLVKCEVTNEHGTTTSEIMPYHLLETPTYP